MSLIITYYALNCNLMVFYVCPENRWFSLVVRATIGVIA
jgi:hypothetical protein